MRSQMVKKLNVGTILSGDLVIANKTFKQSGRQKRRSKIIAIGIEFSNNM